MRWWGNGTSMSRGVMNEAVGRARVDECVVVLWLCWFQGLNGERSPLIWFNAALRLGVPQRGEFSP